MTAPVFVIDAESGAAAQPGGFVTVQGPEGRHAVAVRRLRRGELVNLVDGHGTRVVGEVADVVGRDRLTVAVVSIEYEAPPELEVVVVQALLKGDAGEAAVTAMTEAGVDRIVPWNAQRCVTTWRGERVERGLRRWRSAGAEAGKQSRRAWFPTIESPVDSTQVESRIRQADRAVVLHESARAPLSAGSVPAEGSVLLVVGPEGGIAAEEVARFEAAGARVLAMGPTVMRASTAGSVAVGVISALGGRWG